MIEDQQVLYPSSETSSQQLNQITLAFAATSQSEFSKNLHGRGRYRGHGKGRYSLNMPKLFCQICNKLGHSTLEGYHCMDLNF